MFGIKKFYKSPFTNYDFGVAMGGLLLKLQNLKKVKLIFGHPVHIISTLTFYARYTAIQFLDVCISTLNILLHCKNFSAKLHRC